MKTSVLIPSFGRPASLERCIKSLNSQTILPDELIIVWQADDFATRDFIQNYQSKVPITLLHQQARNIVAAENLAWQNSTGEVVLLIDDDAVAPPTWIAQHLTFYTDPTIGAVGGPADNFHLTGVKFDLKARTPQGILSRYGKVFGNMHTQPPAWHTRRPKVVDHLVGYNVSFRRAALQRFEPKLKAYWQLFELDACLMVAANGYRVVFDYANVVDHHPTNTIYNGQRTDQLDVRIYNGCYNLGFVLSKHSKPSTRFVRLAYLLAIGTRATPGVGIAIYTALRSRNLRLEWTILTQSLRNTWAGWRDAVPHRVAP